MTRKRAILAVMLLAGMIVAPALAAAPAAAQNNTSVGEKAPYYEDETTHTNNESWMEGHENATVANTTHFATRFVTFIIGNEPGATDSTSSSLITGMVLMGALVGVAAGTGVGLVGGGVLAMVTLSGVIAVDLSPEWFFPVALFLIGVLLAAVVKRQMR